VFPNEKYGLAGNDRKPAFYATDPSKPMGDWKEAWEGVRERAQVKCRFHDLRHTACTRMLEAGVPFSVIATIMGWSPSTTIRMAKRYGHIGCGSCSLIEVTGQVYGSSFSIHRDSSFVWFSMN
jgi:hypothetical protein